MWVWINFSIKQLKTQKTNLALFNSVYHKDTPKKYTPIATCGFFSVYNLDLSSFAAVAGYLNAYDIQFTSIKNIQNQSSKAIKDISI